MENVGSISTGSLQRRRRLECAAAAAIIIFVLVFSVSTLTDKPRLSTDEAVSIELAKSFGKNHILDFEYAPGKFTDHPETIQSTGYPVTTPLSLLFSVFGFNFSLARVYMLVWMLCALVAAYMFARRSFDSPLALLSVALIASFASFYANGRTVVGEIPGFALFSLALYLLFERKSPVLAGIMLGFSIAAKPSVFLLALPALLIVLMREPRRFLGRTLALALGILPSALLWLSVVNGNPFSSAFWSRIGNFYRNPYSSDIGANIHSNLAHFFASTTLIYFSILLTLIIAARFFVRRKETALLYDFCIVYNVFAFVYYLRSPGWLRYLLIAELLILLIVPHALLTLVHTLQRRAAFFRKFKLATGTLTLTGLLIVVQLVQLFVSADIYTSRESIEIARYLDRLYPEKTIGILSDVGLYSQMRNPHRSVVFSLTGMPDIGVNPLLENPLPDILVSPSADRFEAEGAEILSRKYQFLERKDGHDIFTLKTS